MKKKFLLLSLLVVFAIVLAACQPATEAPVVEEPTEALRIWADEQRAPVLNDLAADFLAEYNVELVVENISGIRDQFLVAAPAGEGPDLIVVAHDQAPAIIASGLAAPVDLGESALNNNVLL